jgi:arsenate reductase
MKERGIDISRQYSKGIDDVVGPFDLVVTLCDSAARECPASIMRYPVEHWSTPDPSFVAGGPDTVREAFRTIRDRLEGQVKDLVDRVRPGTRGPADDPPGGGKAA